MNVADLIAETQRQLYGVHRGQMNFLAVEISSTDDTLSLEDDPNGIQQGALLAIDDELMLVRTASSTAKTATVKRGWLGTEQSAHSLHSVIEVQPRFPRVEIRRALRDELRSWGSGVFATDQADMTVSAGTRTIDLSVFDPGYFHVLAAIRSPLNGDDADVPLRFKTLEGSLNYPNGAIVLLDPPQFTTTVSVTVATPFVVGDFTDDMDLEDDIGLSVSMFDIPVIGACWRLLSPREINRLDPGAQGEPRSAAEVQAGMIAATARGYLALRDRRLMDEGTRLRGQYPWRF